MKKTTAILGIFFSLLVNAQTPNYFGNNPTWYCGLWDSDQWNFPSEPYTEEYIYYLNGDTIALGFTYHRVFRKGYKNYENTPQVQDVNFDEQTQYYIRQVGRSIRYFTIANNSDSLLVSYEYNVGDTVAGYIFQLNHSYDTIQKIDSVLINSEYRKVFYLDTLNGPVITEAIGHQNEITGSSGEFLKSLASGIGFDYYINCYGQNNNPLWDSNGNGGSCHLNVGINTNPPFIFSLTPNPASNYFTINTSDEKEIVTTIFDLQGKLILKTKDKTIHIENIIPGMYLVEINDQFGNSKRTKLIVI